MLKRIFLAALWLPLAALAQSYPSPHFNNITSDGTAALTNATVSGSFSVTGGVALTGLAPQAANTIVGNATSSSASPTAITVTGCNGAAQALQWTNGSGFQCNSSVATSGANSNITSLTGLTTPVTTAQGGLGSNNSAASGIPVFSSGTATVTATTGSGSPVRATSPVITTPTISGVTGGVCASAGNVGECVNSNVPQGSAVSLTNNTPANVTSVSLTAGNWLCYGNVAFNVNVNTATSQEVGWISTVAATLPTPPASGAQVGLAGLSTAAGANGNIYPVGILMVNVTTTTTVFLEAYASFTTSTNAAYGYINCIRWH